MAAPAAVGSAQLVRFTAALGDHPNGRMGSSADTNPHCGHDKMFQERTLAPMALAAGLFSLPIVLMGWTDLGKPAPSAPRQLGQAVPVELFTDASTGCLRLTDGRTSVPAPKTFAAWGRICLGETLTVHLYSDAELALMAKIALGLVQPTNAAAAASRP